MARINYIIPIKRPDLIVDKPTFRKMLARTIRSVADQDGEKRLFICAGAGTPLPPLPDFAEVVTVEETGIDTTTATDRASYYGLVRLDKGTRVKAGIAKVTDTKEYVMVVDDDDILHRDLGRYVSESKKPLCLITKGFMFNADTGALYRMDDFNKSCGTSVIALRGLYRYRTKTTPREMHFAISELGSHVMLPTKAARKGWPITEVPFRAAVYCTGNRNATQRLIRDSFGRERTAEHTRAIVDLKVTPEERAYIRRGFRLSPAAPATA